MEDVSPAGHRRRYQRDAEGNLIAATDADGVTTRYRVTSWNLRASEVDEIGGATHWEYDARENITAIVDPSGNRSEYRYDQRHHTRALADGEEHRFAYDDRGNTIEASTREHRVELHRDRHGRRLTDLRDGQGVCHSYLHAHLRRTQYFEKFEVTFHRDEDGSARIVTPDGGTHRLSRTTQGSIIRRLANGTRELTHFDAEGRCASRVVWHGSDRIWSAAYEYSREDKLRRVVDSARGTTHYQYDRAHRLASETTEHETFHYRYDPSGNLIATPPFSRIGYAEGNRLHRAGITLFTHNARNHIATATDGDGETRYLYNSFDQLVGVAWQNQPDHWTARYDGLGRRIDKRLGDAHTRFSWDGDRLAAELDAHNRLRLYIYASTQALSPFMFVDYPGLDSAPGDGRAYYVFANQNGMPLAIEDAAGEVVWWVHRVHPYGEIDGHKRNALTYSLRWPGHYHDVATQLHDNRFRSYWPRLGRYLQSDPAGPRGGVNLYVYTSNPVVHVDLRGLSHNEKPAGSESADDQGVNQESGAPSAAQKQRAKQYEVHEMGKQYRGEEFGDVFGTPVKYFDEDARAVHRIEVRDGILVTADGKPFDTANSDAGNIRRLDRSIYVMDTEGRVYAYQGTPERGVIQHSSFVAGNPVVAAGELRVQLDLTDALSGIELPNEAIHAFLTATRDALQSP